MQEGFVFWKNWTASLRYLISAIGSIVAIGIIFFIIHQLFPENYLTTTILREYEALPVIADVFRYGVHQFGIQADSYLLLQYFNASPLDYPTWVLSIFSLGILTFFAISFAGSSLLSKWIFYPSVTILILGLNYLGIEQFTLFGISGSLPILFVVLSFVGPAYYFHAIATATSFGKRLLVFLGISVFWLVVALLGEASAIGSLLALESTPILMIAATFFTAIIAYQPILGILLLIRKTNSSGTLNVNVHLIILSLIYLGNLVFFFLRQIGAFDLGIWLVEPVYIFFLSSLIGFWGIQYRFIQSEFTIGNRIGLSVLYLALILASVLIWCLGVFTKNDPLLDYLENVVLYTHIPFGTFFLLYLIANFVEVLKQNAPVERAVYKPFKLKYFHMRMGSLIFTLAILLFANAPVVNEFKAGTYNMMGDYFLSIGNKTYAKEYYQAAKRVGYQSFKANYTLGHLAISDNSISQAKEWFGDAGTTGQFPHSFLALAEVHRSLDQYLEASIVIEEGLKYFPTDARLLNNKALLMSRLEENQAALLTIDQAYARKTQTEVIAANLMALLAKSLPETAEYPDINDLYDPNQANHAINLLALDNKFGKLNQQPIQIPVDKSLDFGSFSLINNYALNKLYQADEFSQLKLDSLVANDDNIQFRTNLKYLQALHGNAQGDITGAIKKITEIYPDKSESQAYFLEILGDLYLKQNESKLAADYYLRADSLGKPKANLKKALAYFNAGKVLPIYDQIAALNREGQPVPNWLKNYTLGESVASDSLVFYDQYADFAQKNGLSAFLTFNQLQNETLRVTLVADWLYYKWEDFGTEQRQLMLDYLARVTQGQQNSLLKIMSLRQSEEKSGNTKESLQQLQQIKPVNQQEKYLYAFLEAVWGYELGDKSKSLATLAQLSRQQPFMVDETIQICNILAENDGLEYTAYDALLDGTFINSQSPKLLIAYIMLAEKLNLGSYADTAKEKLGQLQ